MNIANSSILNNFFPLIEYALVGTRLSAQIPLSHAKILGTIKMGSSLKTLRISRKKKIAQMNLYHIGQCLFLLLLYSFRLVEIKEKNITAIFTNA